MYSISVDTSTIEPEGITETMFLVTPLYSYRVGIGAETSSYKHVEPMIEICTTLRSHFSKPWLLKYPKPVRMSRKRFN
jgi:hypothetical protein